MHSVRAREFPAQNPQLTSVHRSSSASLLCYRFVKYVLAFCCVALSAFSQQTPEVIQHGTVAIVAFRPNQIVAAIDSAMYDPNENFPPGIGCKMIGLGKYGFFLGLGLEGIKGEFTTSALAQQAFGKVLNVDTPKHRRQVATDWGSLLIANIKRSKYPVLASLRAGNIQTAGVFGFESSDGRLYLYIVYLDVVGQEPALRAVSSFDYIEATTNEVQRLGSPEHVALMDEFAANRTPRAQSTRKQIEDTGTPEADMEAFMLGQTLQFVLQWSPGDKRIHGPIDIVVLKSGCPLRWFQRKTQCAAADH
jgi:hypothetical protein